MHGLPIIEVPLAQPEQIGDVGRFLFENGIYVTLAAYPLVPRSEVGFRIQLTAANTDAEIDAARSTCSDGSPTRSTCSLRSDRPPHDDSSNVCVPDGERVWAWYLAAMAVLTVAYVFVPPFKGYALVINVIGLSSPLAIAVGMRLHRPQARLAWSLLLAGQLLYVAGDFYTYTYPDLLGGTVGFPSAGDAIYLARLSRSCSPA